MMEVDVENHDFVTMFHNLEGITLKDRQKHLFKLLNQTSKMCTPEQIESFLENLHPTNYQEELFKIDALIFFHRTEKLLDIFKGGNIVFVSKIIKLAWFFKETFKNINEEELVNDVLPNLSFSLRMKVLKKLSVSLDEAQMDKLFDCVQKRYGLFIASHFLAACSANKIEVTLQTNQVKLWPNQLKTLFHKHPKLLGLYLEQKKDDLKSRYRNEHNKLYNYIAQKNPTTFCELRDKLEIKKIRLGRRTTKRIVDLKRDDVISNVKEYSGILKTSAMVRRLRDFSKIYLQVFPLYSVGSTSGLHVEFLKECPKKRRWQMFSETFQKKLGKNILENLDWFDESFIKIFSDNKEVLRKWATACYKKTDLNDFLKYFDTKTSIPLLKQKINLTSEKNERTRLLRLLVISCGYNNDLVYLEDVLKYFCSRHRNEVGNVRAAFLRVIGYEINLKNLNENHWKYINELIELSKVRDEFYFSDYYDLICYRLVFLYKNKKLTDDDIKEFMINVMSKSHIETFQVKSADASFNRELLIKILTHLPEHKDVAKMNYYLVRIINDITKFNKPNSTNKIDLSDHPLLNEVCKSVFAKDGDYQYTDWLLINRVLLYNWNCPQNQIDAYNDEKLLQIIQYYYVNNKMHDPWSEVLSNTISWIVRRPNRNTIETKILDLYFNKIMKIFNISSILTYFVKKEPQTIAHYYTKIVPKISINLQWIKRYTHLGLDKQTLTYYKEQEPNEKLFVKAFSVLSSTDEYIKLIEDKYLPKNEKLKLVNKHEKEFYQLQCQAVKSLRNVDEPHKAVAVVLKFSVGLYIKPSLPTARKIFYYTPENLVPIHIQTLWSKRAASARKQAVSLACELLEQQKAIHLLKFSVEKEDNVSVRNHLISAILKYFLKNQCVELFNLFTSNMNFIDKNDKDFLQNLMDISKIPSEYTTVYLQKTWEFFDSFEEKDVTVKNYLKPLLKHFDKNMVSKTDSEFCKRIIKRYFLKNELEDIDVFTYYFLAVYQDHQVNFDFVFQIIRDFKNKHFFDEKSARKLQIVFKFFCTCYDNIKNNKDAVLALQFKQYWEQTFTIKESFDQIVLLNMLKFYNDNNYSCTEKFADAIIDFFEQLLSDFGTHVIHLLVAPLVHFFRNELCNLNYVLLRMLNSKENIEFRILAQKIIRNFERSELNGTKELIKKCESDILYMV